jgi:hypothetical protein
VTLDLRQARGDDAATAPPLDPAMPFAPAPGFDGAQRRRTITMFAVARDLDRLGGVLAGPVTPVRRAALAGHVGFLVEQARPAGDDPPGRHSVALSRLRHESRLWSRDPLRRADLRAAVEVAAAAVDSSRAAVRAGCGSEPTSTDRTVVRLRDLPARRPTAAAYRYFWLLDELPSHLAQDVTTGFSGPARWALRNGLSGGYNRRAHLMWIGGGSGPAL